MYYTLYYIQYIYIYIYIYICVCIYVYIYITSGAAMKIESY